MRRLTILVAVLALIYSAYWFIGATATERGARQVLDNMQSDGWQVSYDDISTRGYPSRFDTTFTALNMQAPDGDFGYTTPFVQALSLSYQPNKIIGAFPDTQTVRIGQQDIAIKSKDLRASVAIAANTALSLDSVTAQTGAATLTSNAGWSLALDRAILALRKDGPTPNTYDVYFDADAVVLPDWLRDVLNPLGVHPDAIGTVSIDLTVVLDRPLDRNTLAEIEFVSPHLTKLTLNTLTLNWGEMTLTGSGDFTVDADGLPIGVLTFTALAWRDMLKLAVASGYFEPSFELLFESVFGMLAQGKDTLDLPFTFKDGAIYMGSIPVGPAPRFH